ncbi:MAG TPA: polyprenyl synthetase family protein, partial [Actinomycetota bacterium]
MPRDVPRDPSDDPSAALRALVDEELRHALDDARTELEGLDAASAALVDELRRLLDAGGSRLRPMACVWGFRAGGGSVGPAIVRAAAALELLHEMALIHDDVMDDAKERRGVASTHRAFAERAAEAAEPDPERAGLALAVLAGDLAAVLADRL